MEPLTFIFIGRSGCGKGTQAALLIEALKRAGRISSKQPVFYLETGDKFRDFIGQTSHSSRLAKEIMDRSERQPDFLAVWMWSHLFVANLMGDEQLVLDGTPRSLPEAQVLDTALNFYHRNSAHIVYLDVSNDWSTTRLAERGRADDKTKGDIAKRLAWFETDVQPAIDFYTKHSTHHFHKINGEQSIEKVHQDLIASLALTDITPVSSPTV